MALIACSQCSRQYEDDVLCCPHCGEAQIPQLSKAQLRLEMMKASQGALAFIYLGLAAGMLAGVAYLVVTLLNGTADLVSGLAILMGGMGGSAAGFVLHWILHRPSARKTGVRRRVQP